MLSGDWGYMNVVLLESVLTDRLDNSTTEDLEFAMSQQERRSRGSARSEKRAKRVNATRAGIPYITRRIPPF